MKLSDALVEALLLLDARYVFGVSGANIEHFHDAIHRRGQNGKNGKLTSVLSRSESGSAFMADARARVHRTLGVCCSTSGGGMMNLAVGLAESYAESVPVLAIVGQPPPSLAGRGAFQDSSGVGATVDAVSLFTSISKLTTKILRPQDFWESFLGAVAVAQSGRPGPAVLLIPRTLYDQEVSPPPTNLADEIDSAIRADFVDLDVAQKVFDDIRRARHPVMILGHGVRRSRNRGAVQEFARLARIPVVTTMSARGEFDNDDRLYLGILGVAGHPSVHDYLRHTADLLIVVGAGLNTMTRAPFARDPIDLPARRIIAVNIDPSELHRIMDPERHCDPPSSRSFWHGVGNPLSKVLESDAGVVFELLLDLWYKEPFECAGPGFYARTYFAPTLSSPVEPLGPVSRSSTLLQSDALAIFRAYLPKAGHVLFDAGNCAASALHYLDLPRGVSGTIALGMGGMGYAIAGGVGAQLGSPSGHRTVVFAGDGAFFMAGFEVHTAVDLRLPILFVIFNNNMHGMCVTRQQLFFAARLEAVRYKPVNIAQVARGFGGPEDLWVARVTTAAELVAALDDYTERNIDRPGVLELCLEQEEVPPFVPFLGPSAPELDDIVPSVPPSRRNPI
jgi:acetolactate synthase-1/2/3 large subunit